MERKDETARALFLQGRNCAQSVFCAFAPDCGIPMETALRLSSGLGGGMGRLRSTCGAVTGMVMALGLLYGYNDLTDPGEKQRTYALVQRLVKKFRAENGSLLCSELLGVPGEEEPVPERRTEEYYVSRPCPGLVACAARLLEEYGKERAGETRKG